VKVGKTSYGAVRENLGRRVCLLITGNDNVLFVPVGSNDCFHTNWVFFCRTVRRECHKWAWKRCHRSLPCIL